MISKYSDVLLAFLIYTADFLRMVSILAKTTLYTLMSSEDVYISNSVYLAISNTNAINIEGTIVNKGSFFMHTTMLRLVIVL